MSTITTTDLLELESYSDVKPLAQDVMALEQLGAKLICFKPGQSLPPHHTGAEAFFLILKGQGEITIGNERFDATPQKVIPAPARVDHGITNTGEGDFVILLVQSPNPFFCC